MILEIIKQSSGKKKILFSAIAAVVVLLAVSLIATGVLALIAALLPSGDSGRGIDIVLLLRIMNTILPTMKNICSRTAGCGWMTE